MKYKRGLKYVCGQSQILNRNGGIYLHVMYSKTDDELWGVEVIGNPDSVPKYPDENIVYLTTLTEPKTVKELEKIVGDLLNAKCPM